jgi:hypothetical protein
MGLRPSISSGLICKVNLSLPSSPEVTILLSCDDPMAGID